MSVSSEKTIQLKCSDGKTFEIDEATAIMSNSLKSDIKIARRYLKPWRGISVTLNEDRRVPSEILEKVIHYCERHAHARTGEDLTAFDAQFVDLDLQQLCKLAKAAIKLEIRSLLELVGGPLSRMAGTEDEVRSIVHIFRSVPF